MAHALVHLGQGEGDLSYPLQLTFWHDIDESRTSRGTIVARRHTGSVRLASLRWWFENRKTGQITIAQFPNWPLWGIAATWLVTALARSSALGQTASWARTGLWLYWAGDEIVRGVNPWRRAVGVAVVAWQAGVLVLG